MAIQHEDVIAMTQNKKSNVRLITTDHIVRANHKKSHCEGSMHATLLRRFITTGHIARLNTKDLIAMAHYKGSQCED